MLRFSDASLPNFWACFYQKRHKIGNISPCKFCDVFDFFGTFKGLKSLNGVPQKYFVSEKYFDSSKLDSLGQEAIN